MSRAVFLGLVLFALLIASLAALRGAMLALAFPVLLYLIYGLWRGRKVSGLRSGGTERRARNTGDDRLGKVSVTNAGEAVDELVLEDRISPALSISQEAIII